MREKMFKYFTANSTRRYIDVLESIVVRYNDTRHSSIKMSPKDTSMKKNKTIVWTNLNSINNFNSEPIKPKFSVGDKLRITRKKTTFEKGYTARWSEEIFRIKKIIRKRGNKSFVKWLGYPESFNSWVDNKTLMTL